ncbi:diphthine--ammonia ligase [Gillisia limnaea]|uniref:ATP binding protein n=1 Tax=Gillisia limnaea (strain DSM 15749 / LMG 21470 / R-8282) TaxID=865937 RepID=H2BZ85_GILLR|nr:diphthine--ammonia ligase [Gillisia limnaea]EHQ01214.1 ATP binding protein [Gillisia limnaea DSM 15749]
MQKAYLNWSSGKDAAYSLYKLQQENTLRVEKLVTTLNSEVDRVSMHGLRKELLILQAKSIGLPIDIIALEGNVSMQSYNSKMHSAVSKLLGEGFTHSVFGDIFLEDLKEYREEQLARVGIQAVFPLWKQNTHQLISDFIDSGFKAITVCVNAKVLDRSFCGRIIDQKFVEDLPSGVDPCGENGEFHTFVFDGPIFKNPIEFEKGEIVQRSYNAREDEEDNCFTDDVKSWDTSFWYCDLIPR